MKLISFLIIAGLGIVLFIVGANDDDEYLEIRSPVFMPELSQEEIFNAAITGEYDEFFIEGGISAGGFYEYHYRIFNDGSAILRETVCTEFMKEYIVENDYKESPTGPPFPEEYIEMIEVLPEGTYSNYYLSKITMEDILSLLNDLGDGTLPAKDLSKNYQPGFGMGFGLNLYLNGKAIEYYGTKYEPNDDDVDVEILDWLENKLIPLLKDKGEITDWGKKDILNYIPDELVGKYSFIEIRRD